jgi:hypothetical protein
MRGTPASGRLVRRPAGGPPWVSKLELHIYGTANLDIFSGMGRTSNPSTQLWKKRRTFAV